MADSNLDLSKFPNIFKDVITNPVGFYRGMAKDGGYSEPLLFLIAMGVISALIQILLGVVGLGGVGYAAAWGLFTIIVLPIFIIIFGFIIAGIMFLIWKIMGSEESYQTAFRCIAYASAISPVVAIFSVIPYIGTIVNVVWGFFLMITASIETHKVSKNASYIVFGVLGLVFLVIGISGESTQRQYAEMATTMKAQNTEMLQNMEGKTPEEMGKALGEFMKGMQDGAKKQ